MNPTVSVLMTAYNREKYIAEAMESVLASTFKDFELIIVDDCSKDRTIEIARHYETDSRVRVYLNEKNLGDYPNRNRAAELARGKYLKYVDADDLIYPHGLSVMVDSMERFPSAGLGLALPQDADKPYPFPLSSKAAYEKHFFHHYILYKAPLSAIIQREAFREVGGFSTSEGPRSDAEMWLRMAARFDVLLMPNGLVWWRAHEEQESRYRLSAVVEDTSRLYLLILAALENPTCPLDSADRERAIRFIQRGHARRILKMAVSAPGTANSIRRASKMKPHDLLRALTKL
jgi:glycosyltransferase involved in cell wall biosynthesis